MAKASRRNGRPAAPAAGHRAKLHRAVEFLPAQHLRELNQAVAKNTTEILAGHEAAYRRDRDPFRAWGALIVCRQRGRPIPRWVWTYLDEASKKLDAVYFAARARRPVLLARALGFTRDGRPKGVADRNEEIALAVVEARRTADSWKAAKYAVVHDRELSFETVDRAYRDWKKRQKVL